MRINHVKKERVSYESGILYVIVSIFMVMVMVMVMIMILLLIQILFH